MTTTIPYTKLVGVGNDFVLLDTLRHDLASLRARWPQVARRLCDRRKGIGADGLLVLEPSRVADVRMRIFNPDGSEPPMCGNGIRCLAWYAHRTGTTGKLLSIETGSGIRQAEIQGAHRVRVDMGTPRLVEHLPELRVKGEWLGHADVVNSGVPHLVCWVEDVGAVNVERLGRTLRFHRRFQPNGTNVDFVTYLSSRDLKDKRLGKPVHCIRVAMRTYERGVEGETKACGTGAVAAATAAVHAHALRAQRRRTSRLEWFAVEVLVSGGVLRVQLYVKSPFDENRLTFTHAFLEGTAQQVAQGTFPWNGRAA